MQSAKAYGAYVWKRTKRLLLLGYLAQWGMLLLSCQASLQEYNLRLFTTPFKKITHDPLTVILNIFLPVTYLSPIMVSVFYHAIPSEGSFLWSFFESTLLNMPAWFAGEVIVLWMLYPPFITYVVRPVERAAGSSGLLVLLTLAIAFEVAVEFVFYDDLVIGDTHWMSDNRVLWRCIPLFFGGTVLACLSLRHDAVTARVAASPPGASPFYHWLAKHQATLRGGLADVAMFSWVLKTSMGYVTDPEGEYRFTRSSALRKVLTSLLWLMFVYGSTAKGGAGLTAATFRHQLLRALNSYALPIYVLQQMVFTGIFRIPYQIFVFAVKNTRAGASLYTYYPFARESSTYLPLTEESLNAPTFAFALFMLHVFAVMYVDGFEARVFGAGLFGMPAWWQPVASRISDLYGGAARPAHTDEDKV